MIVLCYLCDVKHVSSHAKRENGAYNCRSSRGDEIQSAHFAEALHTQLHCNKRSAAQVSQSTKIDDGMNQANRKMFLLAQQFFDNRLKGFFCGVSLDRLDLCWS